MGETFFAWWHFDVNYEDMFIFAWRDLISA